MFKPIADWEPDNAVWGQNYPREHETYLRGRADDTRTRYGEAFPRNYLKDDPRLVILWSGYGFSKDCLQGRGHYHSTTDVRKTARIKKPYNAGTCLTCKSTDVPRVMSEMGAAAFYAANFHDLTAKAIFRRARTPGTFPRPSSPAVPPSSCPEARAWAQGRGTRPGFDALAGSRWARARSPAERPRRSAGRSGTRCSGPRA